MKKSAIICSILISFFFISINSKRCNGIDKCPDQFEETTKNMQAKDIKANLKYSLANKKIDFSVDGKKLTMNFNSILNKNTLGTLGNPFDELKIIYIVRIYDKEKLGIDNLQAILENEKPLTRHAIVKLSDEITPNISWEVEIDDNENKDQIVQLIAEASSIDGTERFMYDSFIFNCGEDKHQDLFWIILAAMVGVILLTYVCLTLYILCKGDDTRPSLKVNDISAVQSDEDRPTLDENS